MKANVPHLPAEVAQAIKSKDLDIPTGLVKLMKEPDVPVGAQQFLQDMYTILKGGNHFYLENLKLFWDLDYRGLDMSEVRMPFPVTVLFYHFTNEAVDMPPIDPESGDFEQGKTVLVVSDIVENGMLHIHGYTDNPVTGAEWMMLPVSAVIYRDDMEDMSNVITKTHFRARLQAPVPGLDYVKYMDRMKELGLESEEQLANMISDHLRVVVGFLAISAAKNVPRVVVKPPPKLNKKRIKRGKVPFHEYHILDVFRDRARTMYEETESKADDDQPKRASPKLHLVRGHMVQKQSGLLYYRAPHLRGDPGKGVVNKDYRT